MNKKKLVSGGLLVLTFIIGFYIFNLLPLIKVTGDGSIFSPLVRWCSLNYWYCYSDMGDVAIPNFLQSQFFALFLLPIVLPTLFSFLVFKLAKRKEPIAVVLIIPAVILAVVAGYFVLQFVVDRVYRPEIPQQAIPRPTQNTQTQIQTPVNKTFSESEVIASLKTNWQAVQASIPFRPAYHNQAEDAKKIWRTPTAVQFIGKNNILVRFEDDNNAHVAVFNFNGSKFNSSEVFKNQSEFTLSDWQNLINKYGDSSYSVGTYTTGLIRNKQVVSFPDLTKVSENIFVKNYWGN